MTTSNGKLQSPTSKHLPCIFPYSIVKSSFLNQTMITDEIKPVLAACSSLLDSPPRQTPSREPLWFRKSVNDLHEKQHQRQTVSPDGFVCGLLWKQQKRKRPPFEWICLCLAQHARGLFEGAWSEQTSLQQSRFIKGVSSFLNIFMLDCLP